GINFWAVHKYRDKEPGLTIHTGFKKIESGNDGGGFVATNNYVGPDGKIVCSDERTVRFYPVKSADDPRLLDFTVTIFFFFYFKNSENPSIINYFISHSKIFLFRHKHSFPFKCFSE
ncbi:MAG: DUF6807 family protein, partial [Patescibacteria group bacterium]